MNVQCPKWPCVMHLLTVGQLRVFSFAFLPELNPLEFILSFFIYLDPPKNTKVLVTSKGNVMEGHLVNLTCISNANPPVEKYAWYMVGAGQALAKGSVQNLTFYSVQSHHSGQYFCIVWSVLGTGTSPSFTLSVLCKFSFRVL